MASISDPADIEIVHYPNLPTRPGNWCAPAGEFFGPWPVYHPDWPTPQPNEPCVYWLYDHSGRIRYVGRTLNLMRRLGQHSRDGKVFAFWVAHIICTELPLAEAIAIYLALADKDPDDPDDVLWNKSIPIKHWREQPRPWGPTDQEDMLWAIQILSYHKQSAESTPPW